MIDDWQWKLLSFSNSIMKTTSVENRSRCNSSNSICCCRMPTDCRLQSQFNEKPFSVKQSQTTCFSTIRINNNGKRAKKNTHTHTPPNRFVFEMHWQSGLFFWRYRFDLWRQTLNWQLTYGGECEKKNKF